MTVLSQAAKRAIDLVGSTLGLFLLAPVLAITALVIRATMGSPVLFSQPRVGLRGKVFGLRKFRTMRDAVDNDGAPLADEHRLTRLGRFLRAYSIDELPELYNVLKGEMSLVGPRPLLVEYLPRYMPEQARRHEVKPGITGWAQINGRNALTWEQKFALDVWYVDHRSLALDLFILLKTVVAVLGRQGINAGGHATMPAFMGSEGQMTERRVRAAR